jgi:hypothetical protein
MIADFVGASSPNNHTFPLTDPERCIDQRSKRLALWPNRLGGVLRVGLAGQVRPKPLSQDRLARSLRDL